MTAELTNETLEGMPLEGLAELANDSAITAETHATKAVNAACFSGRVLLVAKTKCEHGNWLQWLEANWKHSERRAQQFMALAKANHDSLLDSAGSIREALRLIDKPDEDTSDRTTPENPLEETSETAAPVATASSEVAPSSTADQMTQPADKPPDVATRVAAVAFGITSQRRPIDRPECRASLVTAIEVELNKWQPADCFAVFDELRAAIPIVTSRINGDE